MTTRRTACALLLGASASLPLAGCSATMLVPTEPAGTVAGSGLLVEEGKTAKGAKQEEAPYGRLAPEAIQKGVRERSAKFRACYERELVRDPKLHGRVIVRLLIGRDGFVTSAIDGLNLPPLLGQPRPSPAPEALVDPQVVACVLTEAKKLVFPRPDGGLVTVEYPLLFTPDAPKAAAGAAAPAASCSTDCKGSAPSALTTALTRATRGVAHCWTLRTPAAEQALPASGTFHLTVEETGAACGASVVGPTKPLDPLAMCVADVFTGMNLPPPVGGCLNIDIPVSVTNPAVKTE